MFDETTINAIPEILETEVANKAYDDLAHPTLEETGKFIGRIPRAINAALAGIDIWIAEREYNVAQSKKLLNYKLTNLDPEKISPPEQHIAIPACQALAYSMDSEELRSMYANLLSSSMYDDTRNLVHPSFVSRIQSMSPFDCHLFEFIFNKISLPLGRVRFQNKSNASLVNNYKHIALNTTVGINIYDYLLLYSDKKVSPEQIQFSLSTLYQLGLVDITFEKQLQPIETEYHELDDYNLLSILETEYNLRLKIDPAFAEYYGDSRIYVIPGMVSVTPYGKQFAEICLQGPK